MNLPLAEPVVKSAKQHKRKDGYQHIDFDEQDGEAAI